MTTAIIGAGLAGVFAARRLREAGEDVYVLEATEYLGGRTRGDREALKHGAIGDLGASWLDRGQDRLLSFCLENDIKLGAQVAMYPKGPGPRYSGASILLGNVVVGGAPLATDARQRLAAQVQDALDSQPPGLAETVLAWARRVGLPPDAFDAYTMQTGFNPVQRPGMTSSWHVHPGDIGRICWLLDGSTDVLAHRAAEGLDISYREPVRLVSRGPGGYRLLTDRGEHRADDVIITSSVNATRRIGFDPVLPSWKLEALLQSPMTQGGKVIGQYEDGRRIIDAAGPSTLTDTDAAMFWYKPTGQDTVTVLGCMPDSGNGLLDDEAAALTLLDSQVEAAAGFTPKRIAGLVHNWTSQEFFGGVVSSQTGGAARREVMAASVGGLHFAGEATGTRWATAMEGAVRSGERAADTVLGKRRALRGVVAPAVALG
ncbi:NAD(P)/FAD-dependent oxidoreductase [Aeromicrobium sp. 50.2.37]|uniref:flavin monoamine oxidase family protein n=1 Tax=Aeromicrobium sp. 50.2.37 TaxID=2969305 RepID=UPI002150087C|nr:NAD(P)/FAD-dependent oxidoreductase [Aeromicrobium sp. 50.2.37]MCR4512654.1 FAD-dependent oxidoreductase [Aeromicrobium sp. 50.2.37]